MQKIYEFIDYGAIVTFYDHGTHVEEVTLYLDERRSLEPEAEVLSHEEAEKKIARLQERQG